MERLERRRRLIYFPAPCPACHRSLQLVVGGERTVTTQFHNVMGCNATINYRCWLPENTLLPIVVFLNGAEALVEMLRRDSGNRDENYEEDPEPPTWRFPHAARAY